ncbi:hypothetical protein D9M72_472270 [compost metagenome]
MLSVAPGSTGHCSDIGSRIGLGKRKGGDPFAAGDLRQNGLLQCLGARKADRAGAKPLHGEGEIGKAVRIGKRFADETERPAIDLLAGTAECLRHAMAKHACGAESADEVFARGIGICVINLAEAATGYEVIQLRSKRTMAIVEERPVEMVAGWWAQSRVTGTHAQFPLNSGFALAAKASKARRKSPVAMQIAWAWASDSISWSMPIAHSWSSIFLVIAWANQGPSAMVRANFCASPSNDGRSCRAL